MVGVGAVGVVEGVVSVVGVMAVSCSVDALKFAGQYAAGLFGT